MGLSAVSMVASPVFAHMGFKLVLTGFQVGPNLVRTHVGPISLPIGARRGIRLDFKWGPFSQPTWASHVGPMFLKKYGALEICPVYAHAHLAHLHPLWGPFSKPTWASHVGPMKLKPHGTCKICPVQAHAHSIST